MGSRVRRVKHVDYEKDFHRAVCEYLGKLPNTYHVSTDGVRIRGVPDILISLSGIFVALELKRNLAEAASSSRVKLQKWRLKKIEATGGYAFLVDPYNWEEVKEKLNTIAKGVNNAKTNTQETIKPKLSKCYAESIKSRRVPAELCFGSIEIE